MARTTPESKPSWAMVPSEVSAQVERLLGAPVIRARRAFGGFAPSATFRILLADGRRAFVKGIYPTRHSGIEWRLEREEQVYRGCEEFMRPWAPEFLGGFKVDDWHVIVLEDLGAATTPPWTAAKAHACASSYAAFHLATSGKPLPDWLSRVDHHEFARLWSGPLESGDLSRTASLAGRRSRDAASWLREASPVLQRASERLECLEPPFAFLHFDTRSDNVRLQGEQLRLFDWNFACVGPPEFDVAAFAQSIAAEGGPEPERFVSDYESVFPLRQSALEASIAGIAGYFADRAWHDPIPGMPRLRPIQRRQLKATLRWAARQFELPEPSWLSAVAD